jgi:cystathionine beta-lyase
MTDPKSPQTLSPETTAKASSIAPSLSSLQLSEPKQYRPATQCVHVAANNVTDPYNASSMPIYQTATFKQQSATEMGEYDYSRSGNPTRSFVEQHLAKLMGASRALCLSSGMTALDIILRLVKSGQEIVAGDDIYGGSNRLLAFLQQQQNIKVHHIDTTNVEEVVKYLNCNTKLVLLETPTNPLIKIVNIPAICAEVRKKCSDCFVVVDNTMMSPYLQKPLELGADIVYHSGTKYLSGHHDLMCGVLGVKSPELGDVVEFNFRNCISLSMQLVLDWHHLIASY